MAPVTLPTWVTATTLVRSVMTSSACVGEDATVVIQIEPFEGGAGARGKFLEWQQYGMVFRAGDDDLVARFQGETLSDLATTPQ